MRGGVFMQNYMRHAFLIMIGLSALGTVWISYQYFFTAYMAKHTTQLGITATIDSAVTRLEQRFGTITRTVHELAEWLSSTSATPDELAKRAEQALHANEDVFGIVLGYIPFAIDKQKKLYSKYFVQENKKIELRDLPYDYTLPSTQAGAKTEWYSQPLRDGNTWAEPFYGSSSKKHVITYGERVYAATDKQKTTPIGVVAAVISLNTLRAIVNSLTLGSAGYGFVVSRKGTFASHPIDEYYLKEKNLFDLAKENKSLQLIAHALNTSDTGTLTYTDEISGQHASLVYRAITGTSLILAATFLREELLAPYNKTLTRHLLLMIISLTILLLLATLYLLTRYYTNYRYVMWLVSAFSLVLLLGIISIWFVVRTSIREENESQIILLNDNTVGKAIHTITKQTNNQTTAALVKTGILLQSVRYVSTNQINVTGLLWQRYPSQLDTKIPRDFVLPSSESFSLKELLYKQKNDTDELVVWRFSALLNQEHFSSQFYPFDEQNLRIIIEHPLMDTSALILVPDLAAYTFIAPRLLPGLQSTVSIDGRFLIKSFFSFRPITSNININDRSIESSNDNHLSFSVITDRFLGNALIIYLLPVFVALIFLSVIPVFVTSDLKNTLSCISLMAGIFLALSFTHLQMRKAIIESGGICYLEYYYILLYIFICIAIAYSAIYYLMPHSRIFNKNGHLLIKTMLWPIYLMLAFIITAVTFLE